MNTAHPVDPAYRGSRVPMDIKTLLQRYAAGERDFRAWYIASSAYFISTLGATLTLGFVVFGQAIAGIIADHFGWLGLPQHRLTRYRRIAIGLFTVALFFLIQ